MRGTFQLHALPAGTLSVPASFVFFGIGDASPTDLAFYVWIVSDGTTVGLVDTGLPLGAADLAELRSQEAFTDVRLLPDLLRDAGLAGSDIDFVAVTQTVSYHTGGIDAELLPRAHLYVGLPGIVEMLCEPPGHPAPIHYFTRPGWGALRDFAIGGRLHCVSEPTTICPGVVFETTGGHHPGSAALRIQTAAGTTSLLETAFVQENLDRVHPIGICEDVATARAVMRRHQRECDDVIAIHEPANAARFPLDGFVPPRSARRDT